MKKTIFAGGCFWCMVQPFDTKDGIKSVVSGYTAGHIENPTYEEVKLGKSGHTEAVEITYNPDIISYEKLISIYWTVTDPTDAFGQFHDRGDSYRPVIFYQNEEEKVIAEKSKQDLKNSGKYSQPIVTAIEAVQPFYRAEEEHQNFYQKNPERYAKEKQDRNEWVNSNES